jgi:hypothetical protein
LLVPRQQLAVGERKAGGLASKIIGQFWGGTGTKKILLQEKVFSGTLDAAGLNVRAASRTKPMSGRDRAQLHAFKMERGVAAIANNTSSALT